MYNLKNRPILSWQLQTEVIFYKYFLEHYTPGCALPILVFIFDFTAIEKSVSGNCR